MTTLRKGILRFSAVFLLLLLTTGCMHASPRVTPSQAFSPRTVTADIPPNLQERGVRRIRPVMLNIELFDEKAARAFLQKKAQTATMTQSTQMIFFPNVDLTVDWINVERMSQPAGFVWTGRVAGAPMSSATMVVSGINVTANISRGDGWIYQIRTTPDGRWWIREIDQKEFPQEGQPRCGAAIETQTAFFHSVWFSTDFAGFD